MNEIRQVSLRIHRESDHVWAEVAEMPGVFATGGSIAELLEALEEAIGVWLSPSAERRAVVKLDVESPLPEPRRRHESTVPARAELVPC